MEWAEPSPPAWCWQLVWAVADAAVAAAVLGLGRMAKGTGGSADPDLQGEHGADGTGRDSASLLPWGRYMDAAPESPSEDYWERSKEKALPLCTESGAIAGLVRAPGVHASERMLENRRGSARSDQINATPGNKS